MIYGNKDGVRDSVLKEMEGIYELGIERDEFCPLRLIEAMAKYSSMINREIAVYLGRSGEVLYAAIGDIDRVDLPDLRKRRSRDVLSGVRCIHTHPGGSALPSQVDLQSMRKMRFDAMVVIGLRHDGTAGAVSASFMGEPLGNGRYQSITDGPYGIYQIPNEKWIGEVNEAGQRVSAGLVDIEEKQRVFLAGIGRDTAVLDELERLADTAGMVTVGRAVQSKERMEPATYIGSGKAKELTLAGQAADADVFIFDDELTYTQMKNLEEILGRPIKDRTGLILDIFAQRAQSREGKLQVELAKMRYELPRLQGLGVVLSRIGGGSGLYTRGAGETQLESDRRRFRRHIHEIEKEIGEMRRQRGVRRERREKSGIPVVALVGYTNAGKSTLLNALSGASAYTEDKLFATLDPITRKAVLPRGGECLFVDTVGFIRKLPHDLVAAFKSTLEEALHADLLIVVSDGASDEAAVQHETVLDILGELGAGSVPRIVAINKADLGRSDAHVPAGISISAKNSEGLDALLGAIEESLASQAVRFDLTVPFADGKLTAYIHDKCTVLRQEYGEEGTVFSLEADPATRDRVMSMSGSR